MVLADDRELRTNLPHIAGQLWADWELPRMNPGDRTVKEKLEEAKVDKSVPPDTTGTPSDSPEALAQRELRKLKLDTYRDVISYFNGEDEKTPLKFKDLIRDLLSDGVTRYPIEVRLSRATEGKDAANKKYKERNWNGAMYTYAIAWGLLLPYYPEAFALSDPIRAELGKLECALFSNISAMAKVGIEAATTPQKARSGLIQIGIAAAQVCISSREFVSVGIVEKSCRRARELSEKQKKSDPHKLHGDMLRFLKEQEVLLKDIPKDCLFSAVKEEAIARPAQIPAK